MRVYLITGILLFMCGCVATIERIKPSKIYLLDNKRKVTVYRTHSENIYVIDKDTLVISGD